MKKTIAPNWLRIGKWLPALILTTPISGCYAPSNQTQPPPAPRVLDNAEGVAAADLNGDGRDEAILISGGYARWEGGEADLGGALQIAISADLNGDGQEEALLGTGVSRELPTAPSRVWQISAGGATPLWESKGDRSQITDLRVMEGRLWLAAFSDRLHVSGGWLLDGVQEELVREAFGTRQLPLPGDRALVGRIYGEQPRSDGDLLLLEKGKPAQKLPSLRGVRSLACIDLDQDGQEELLVGDGWHYAYGQQGVARVRLLEAPDWKKGRTIASFDGEYTVREILLSPSGIVAVGSSAVHLLRQDKLGWKDTVLGSISETGNVVLFQDKAGPAVLISGSPVQVVYLPQP